MPSKKRTGNVVPEKELSAKERGELAAKRAVIHQDRGYVASINDDVVKGEAKPVVLNPYANEQAKPEEPTRLLLDEKADDGASPRTVTSKLGDDEKTDAEAQAAAAAPAPAAAKAAVKAAAKAAAAKRRRRRRKRRKPRRPRPPPPDPATARRQRFGLALERLLFTLVFTAATTRDLTDAAVFQFGNAVKAQLVEHELLPEHSPSFGKAWADVGTVDELHQWLEGPFVRAVFSPDTFDADRLWRFDGGAPRGSMLGKGKVLGAVRVAQLRTRAMDCSGTVPPALKGAGGAGNASAGGSATWAATWQCYAPGLGASAFDAAQENRTAFGQFGTAPLPQNRPFLYHGIRASDYTLLAGRVDEARAVLGSSFESRHGNDYPAPAFAVAFDPTEGAARGAEQVGLLRSGRYVGLGTRALFVDLAVYSAVLDHVCHARLVAEMTKAGGVITSAAVDVVRVWGDNTLSWESFSSVWDRVMFVLTCVVGLWYGVFAWRDGRKWFAQGSRAFFLGQQVQDDDDDDDDGGGGGGEEDDEEDEDGEDDKKEGGGREKDVGQKGVLAGQAGATGGSAHATAVQGQQARGQGEGEEVAGDGADKKVLAKRGAPPPPAPSAAPVPPHEHNDHAVQDSARNVASVLSCALFVAAVGLRYRATALLPATLPASNEFFIDFWPSFRARSAAAAATSTAVCLNWLLLVQALASVFPLFGLIVDTFAAAAAGVASFGVIFAIVFGGFAQAHALLFGSTLASFRTPVHAGFTLLRSLMGDFDFVALRRAEPVMGPLMFVLFTTISFLVVLNMLIAIIADSYQQALPAYRERLRERAARLGGAGFGRELREWLAGLCGRRCARAVCCGAGGAGAEVSAGGAAGARARLALGQSGSVLAGERAAASTHLLHASRDTVLLEWFSVLKQNEHETEVVHAEITDLRRSVRDMKQDLRQRLKMMLKVVKHGKLNMEQVQPRAASDDR
jgi:hypothetical protein